MTVSNKVISVAVIKPLTLEMPPRSGTAERTYYLFSRLPAKFRTHIISLGQHAHESIPINTSSSLLHLPLQQFSSIVRWCLQNITPEQLYLLRAIFLPWFMTTTHKQQLYSYVQHSELCVLDLPYGISLLKHSHKYLVIYSAHDVEYILRKSTLPKSLLSSLLLALVFRRERQACYAAARIITCTAEDKQRLCELYHVQPEKITVVPNGAEVTQLPFKRNNTRPVQEVLFLGSNCEANRRAARYIHTHIAPSLPELRFTIAGSVAGELISDSFTINYHTVPQQPYTLTSFGLYGTETWPLEISVRWTRPKFGLYVPPAVTEIRIDALNFKKTELVLSAADGSVSAPHTLSSRRETITFTLPKSPHPQWVIGAVADPWRHKGDPRLFGINISHAAYRSKGTWQQIPLKDFTDSTAYTKNNVTYLPSVDDDKRDTLLQHADIALNPIDIGSGSNVKLFRYLAAGLPTITTPFGRRGIHGTNLTHYREVDLRRFPQAIRAMVDNPRQRQRVSVAGRALIQEQYNWNTLSKTCGDVMVADLSFSARN